MELRLPSTFSDLVIKSNDESNDNPFITLEASVQSNKHIFYLDKSSITAIIGFLKAIKYEKLEV